MVKGHDFFKPETRELKQEYWLRPEVGRMSALEGNPENAVSRNERTVFKEMLAASATMTVSVEK